ncbi:MAG: glutamyl-tRNA amidotransferase [Planctomycetes bacterium]|nr:glutamyl-tRNA amidotransferase [Planctomycetota bacterium]
MKPGRIRLAVNGTLMRGLALNRNLTEIGGRFVREAATGRCYRLYSISDIHPAMIRVGRGGASIAIEIWELSADSLAGLLLKEPPGLCVGKVILADGTEVLGVLGEPALCKGHKDITRYGGWRKYMAASH